MQSQEPRYILPRFIREPNAVYHAKSRQYMTSHQLRDFAYCPLYHKQKRSGLIADEIDDALRIGAATHTLTLEGREAFEREYIVGGPINPKTEKCYGRDTKAYAEWEAQQTKGCLSDEEYALV